MILMLLCCLNSLQANDEDIFHLRGSSHKDSVSVLVPIANIRNANAKLIERNHLIAIVHEQDTIINEQQRVIDTICVINKNLQYDNLHLMILNENIENEIDRKNKVIFRSITISSIVGLIIGLIIN